MVGLRPGTVCKVSQQTLTEQQPRPDLCPVLSWPVLGCGRSAGGVGSSWQCRFRSGVCSATLSLVHRVRWASVTFVPCSLSAALGWLQEGRGWFLVEAAFAQRWGVQSRHASVWAPEIVLRDSIGLVTVGLLTCLGPACCRRNCPRLGSQRPSPGDPGSGSPLEDALRLGRRVTAGGEEPPHSILVPVGGSQAGMVLGHLLAGSVSLCVSRVCWSKGFLRAAVSGCPGPGPMGGSFTFACESRFLWKKLEPSG